MIARSPRLWPGKFVLSDAKRLLQQYPPMSRHRQVDRLRPKRAKTSPSARASAAAAPVRPAAEPWLAVVVQVAEARKGQRLAATWKLLLIAGAENAAAPCSPGPRA